MIRPILGQPFVDLEPFLGPFVDLEELTLLDDEICFGLTEITVDYTGGSHKSMGIVPPSSAHNRYADYGQVIAAMSRDQFARFVALSDTPEAFDLDRRHEYEFGEEREWPLNHRQMRYLEYRYGVYFPWKVFYELVPNLRWEDRGDANGKTFTDEARRLFPRTVAFIERLPFARIGRCNLLGLQSNDHGTVHRDGEDEAELGQFITLCPRRDKRLFLWDEDRQVRVPVVGGAYWFDDRNYHGVAADPFFRYSLRVDGVFEPRFLAQLKRDLDGISMMRDGVLHAKGALSPAECARWLRGVYEARAEWTPCFDGVQFTLGRAYYTHLEEGRADEYFAAAPASDALVERALPGLRARVRALLTALVGAPVTQRPGWCGPGLHVFPGGQWLSENGGDVHFDTEGLLEAQRAARVPAKSVIVMLQPPARGGGLRVWRNVYDGDDEVAESERGPSVTVDYAAGDLVAIDSYRLHQIQPFEGTRDRVSLTAHLVLTDGGWQAWF